MAFLGKFKKEDLRKLAEKLGEEPTPNMKIIHLKNLITASESYEEGFVKGMLERIVSDRQEAEEKKLRMEAEEMKLRMEAEEMKLRMEVEEMKLRMEAETKKSQMEIETKKSQMEIETKKLQIEFELKKLEIKARAHSIIASMPNNNGQHPRFDLVQQIPRVSVSEDDLKHNSVPIMGAASKELVDDMLISATACKIILKNVELNDAEIQGSPERTEDAHLENEKGLFALVEETKSTIENLAKSSRADESLEMVGDQFKKKQEPYKIDDGISIHTESICDENVNREVHPTCEREIIEVAHENPFVGHLGESKTKQRILTRDRDQRNWKPPREYGFDKDDRFDQEDSDKEIKQYYGRHRNDRRSRSGHIGKDEPEWVVGGPTSQSETKELVDLECHHNAGENNKPVTKKEQRSLLELFRPSFHEYDSKD